MMLVDTSAWYALFVPGDPNHTAAVAVMESNDLSLVTTDYVVGELLTLLLFRGERHRIAAIVNEFFDRCIADIIWTTESDYCAAIKTMVRFTDKKWSFTDCLSRVVINRIGIATAFAFDEDFRQFGKVAVLPEQS